MSRTLSSSFKAEKEKLTNRPIRLYIVEGGQLGSETLRLAEYGQDVVFNGYTYSAFPMKCETITENASQEVDSLVVSVAMVDRTFTHYLESHDGLRNCKVTIRTVFADLLSEADAYTDDIFYIASAVATAQQVSFSLKSKLDLFQVTVPMRRFYRNICQWKFKSTECGYTGAEASCNHTEERCSVLNNLSRFGGFPGTGSSIWRVFIG